MRILARCLSEPRGSATLELAVLSPILLILLGLVLAAGRVSAADTAVEQAAAAAARSASLSRDARAATATAQRAAVESLRDQGLNCALASADVNSEGFATSLGRPAEVTVEVRCTIALRDLAVPGLPGTTTIVASATSPLDRYGVRR